MAYVMHHLPTLTLATVASSSICRSFKEPPSGTDEKDEGGGGNQPFEGWRPKYKIPLRLFHIAEKRKRSVLIKFEYKGHSSHREFVFDNEAAVSDFCDIIDRNKQLLDIRSTARLDKALGDIKLEKDEKLTLLIDICSGSNLPRSDVGRESDPYVTIRYNGSVSVVFFAAVCAMLAYR